MNLFKKHKDPIGAVFIAFEAVMHIYLAVYLTINWTNLLIWGFTVFELTMFIRLLIKGSAKHHHSKESIGDRHMRHYQFCGCLGDLAVCCNQACPCHWEE